MNPQEIKDLRLEKKLTQEAFGEIFGVSKAAVSRWENGVDSPSGSAMKMLKRLACGDVVITELSDLEVKLLDQNVKLGGFNNREDYLTASLKYLIQHGDFMPINPADRITVLDEPDNVQEFPFFGCMAAGQPVESQIVGEKLSVSSDLDPTTHAIFEVNGESGGDKYPDGSRWLVELVKNGENWTAKKGKPAVFCDENGCYLKIYNGGKVPFASVDPNHPDLYPGENLRLVGYPIQMIKE